MTLIAMETPGPPLPGAGWLSPQTAPTAPVPQTTPAFHCNTGVEPEMTSLQMPGCYHYVTPGSTAEPGSSNTTIQSPVPSTSPGHAAVTAAAPWQLQSKSQQGEEAPKTLLTPAPAPLMFRAGKIPTRDRVIFWTEVKQKAIDCGDIEEAELISVPMDSPSSENWQQGEGTVTAFPVVQAALKEQVTKEQAPEEPSLLSRCHERLSFSGYLVPHTPQAGAMIPPWLQVAVWRELR
ncbi:uncharacterized protein LOC132341431 isoform X2 [Haemorhous mexicanus]|uniref:uncharacterized protein LOC132341431 isoform X2 n=1 Tax=Haemorhous mexicanus TaxID=30427 RepID=UPI0028BE0693|nr:uncharacterized protein LOC132341431 isoform X2 [Haemorhous mexicanus]XP_059728990.1 uncharacterized protein LOC132341431 isoform X2 [Haemorhous mexicanus]XP_059728992.1 uncharacterized protein LOC132341431 isoform X2 [Haemorhous mexicanus]